MALQPPASLRSRLADHDPLLGAWTFLRDPVAAEIASQVGYDYVCIDGQHGLHSYDSLTAQLTAIKAGGDAFPVARVLTDDAGAIGQALDAGAMGVIVPMVNTAEQAAAVVRAARYAPVGGRSIGPMGAGARYGPTYVRTANELVAVIPMIETVEAIGNLDAIAATPGVDALYVGPGDLSLSMGLPPGSDSDDPGFNEALAAVVAACREHDVIPAVHAAPELVAKRVEQGFRMITIGFDFTPMAAGLRAALTTGRG